MQTQIISAKRRGRPRKKGIDVDEDNRRKLRLQLSALMDQNIFISYDSPKNSIQTRRSIKTKDLPIRQEGWESFNENILDIIKQYNDSKIKNDQPNLLSKSFEMESKNVLNIPLDQIEDDTNEIHLANDLSSIHSPNRMNASSVLAQVYEATRAKVKLADIKQYYEDLNNIFVHTNVPPSFIINVDESGFVEYIDERSEIVVVPIGVPDGTVKSINRSSKRSTMIGAISLDGTRLKPCIILTGKRYDKKLIVDGYGQQNVDVIHQENGFMNSSSFAYWADNILFPLIQERRKLTGYQGEVVLLLDGCTSHCSDYFLDQCTFYNVIPFLEPPGSSDQVQALDLGILGIQKCLKCRIKTKKDLSPAAKEVIQIVNSWIKTTTPDNVTSAFNQAGIYVVELPDGLLGARASVEKARAVRNIDHIECQNEINGNKTIKLLDFDN